jgi:hypothetical protein
MHNKIKTASQIAIAIALSILTYRLYIIEKQVEKIEKLELTCKKPIK